MSETQRDTEYWIGLASDAYDQSTTFLDNNYRKQWDENLHHFRSKHAPGSKYYKGTYLHRSKIFRPKTRASVRNTEAATAAAFFSNVQVVNIEAQDQGNKIQRISAGIMQELIQYRLTKTIPWFMILLGGMQDAFVNGVVCSYQCWEYEKSWRKSGDYLEQKVTKDRPMIQLIPVENVRIHPAADWTDPINSSPYVIRMIPMYVGDVRRRMKEENEKTGQPKWKKLTDGEIASATKSLWDSTRSAREGQREEKYDPTSSRRLTDFDVVWVHQNFMRLDGVEVVFHTLGTEYLLSNPETLEDAYRHNERPLVMGTAAIEAHKIFPDAPVQLGAPLQKELNENANQRLDNVKLVLNKRYQVRRGAQVDLQSILRNVPGSVTMVNDINNDVASMEFQDVTGSSYQEQDRLNVDFDEVVGSFSTSSIQTNRKLGETVGGMAMLRGGSNALSEYLIRTFSETWVEPVLRQVAKLEAKYESDLTVLSIAADKAKIWQRYGINTITDEMLDQDLTLTVNVGTGATDPVLKVQHFMMGLKSFTETAAINTELGGPLNMEEIAQEIWGRMGYKDGKRFLASADEEQGGGRAQKAQMEQMMAQVQQAMQQMQQELQMTQQQLAEAKQANEVKLLQTQMDQEGQDRRMALQIRAESEGQGSAAMIEQERLKGIQLDNELKKIKILESYAPKPKQPTNGGMSAGRQV